MHESKASVAWYHWVLAPLLGVAIAAVGASRWQEAGLWMMVVVIVAGFVSGMLMYLLPLAMALSIMELKAENARLRQENDEFKSQLEQSKPKEFPRYTR